MSRKCYCCLAPAYQETTSGIPVCNGCVKRYQLETDDPTLEWDKEEVTQPIPDETMEELVKTKRSES